MRTETLDASRGGMWAWLGQRATAVVILVTIMIHLVLTHFVAIGELSYDNIGERLAMTTVLVNDVVLLVAVVFHALNGVRMVLLDYGFPGTGGRRVLAVFLWIVGVVAVVYGTWALWVWVS